MHPNPIYRSLTRPILWMGMERVPGALLVLGTGTLALAGLMLAGNYIATALILGAGGASTVGFARLAEHDPAFFRTLARRLKYDDIYPARVSVIDTTTGQRSTHRTGRRARYGQGLQ
ncbi:VirB3 family type IV secretion system protein [Ruegeria sp.]|uniref:VirB3 family type IV secretion system protein n=1 Tax=Ruegeria sp. TaxID=1879320 RepID=UPI003AFFDE38